MEKERLEEEEEQKNTDGKNRIGGGMGK